jgi:hypothetical protein
VFPAFLNPTPFHHQLPNCVPAPCHVIIISSLDDFVVLTPTDRSSPTPSHASDQHSLVALSILLLLHVFFFSGLSVSDGWDASAHYLRLCISSRYSSSRRLPHFRLTDTEDRRGIAHAFSMTLIPLWWCRSISSRTYISSFCFSLVAYITFLTFAWFCWSVCAI